MHGSYVVGKAKGPLGTSFPELNVEDDLSRLTAKETAPSDNESSTRVLELTQVQLGVSARHFERVQESGYYTEWLRVIHVEVKVMKWASKSLHITPDLPEVLRRAPNKRIQDQPANP